MLLKKNKLFWQNTQLWDISLILYSIPHGCKTFAIVSFLQYHYPKCIVLHQSWFAKSAIDGWWSGFSIHLRHPEKIRRYGNSVLVECLLRNKFLACWQVGTSLKMRFFCFMFFESTISNICVLEQCFTSSLAHIVWTNDRVYHYSFQQIQFFAKIVNSFQTFIFKYLTDFWIRL